MVGERVERGRFPGERQAGLRRINPVTGERDLDTVRAALAPGFNCGTDKSTFQPHIDSAA
jgi:hypothetical protein